MPPGRLYIIGTSDTKRPELEFLRARAQADGIGCVVVDVSTRPPTRSMPEATIGSDVVAAFHPEGAARIFAADRGAAIEAMSQALALYLASRDDLAGVLAIGGSGGTALAAPALSGLPVGMPKLIVSTVASGNVGPYVGGSDIAMLYPVTDLAGLNRISRLVLANAAAAIAGMLRQPPPAHAADRPAVGLTMFGVTTPCVNRLVERLSASHECLVFHATGTGGQSMERLVEAGLIEGVLDITTTEVCDLLLGGVFPCGEDRLGAIARRGVPYVGSCGALDMVNFGALETVPPQYRDRLLHVHNPQVTLMRTTRAECARIGEWIAERLNRCDGPVRFLLPQGGVSLLDAPGLPFHDPEADAALFAALEGRVRCTPDRRLIRVPHAINDPAFADIVVEQFEAVTKG